MPYYTYHAGDPDPEPNWWLAALAAFLLYLILVVVVRADPVPERFNVHPPAGNRGLPELRDPALSTVDISHLLRSCARCHSERGPNTKLFERGRLRGLPLERVRWSIGVVLNSREDDKWYPTDAERVELEKAKALLAR